ncbi:MAG TPA: 4Fe-4S ferredoxin [Bdellovibrionales bacterium]|nr:4Fe-4S ferredoxin [Bdellovibrionales bacterium]
MVRKIIQIDDQKCDGCGLCIPNCPEGAIQILDGKARLVSDRFCDGLGACLGYCPQGAITVLRREAEAYDESLVMEQIVQHGPATIHAHLKHLKEHGETELFNEAILFLKKRGISLEPKAPADACACPGAESKQFRKAAALNSSSEETPSALTHWPVQMHLIPPAAPQYCGKDVLLAADCVAFSVGDFHTRHLPGKALAIACPKLDSNQDIYVDKLVALIDQAQIRSLHVMIMQVPCCRSLLQLALAAAEKAKRRVPIKYSVVSLQGEILKAESVQ